MIYHGTLKHITTEEEGTKRWDILALMNSSKDTYKALLRRSKVPELSRASAASLSGKGQICFGDCIIS